MKKQLLLLCLINISIIAFGQTPSIPNGNFEQWTSSSCENPQYYPNNSNGQNFFRYGLPFNVIKTLDAYQGTYAAQLTTYATATDTAFAYFVNANPNGPPSSWTGGMAYNQKPAGIRGYFKYNVATADSATIIVAFSKAGVNIGTYIFLIGGIHSTYTLFDHVFTPALTLTPDSVVFAALSCKLSNGSQKPTGPPGSSLFIDSVSFTGVTSQPAQMNGDFELWQPQLFNMPDNWFVQTDMGEGFNKTPDAKAGNYALELITTASSDQFGNPRARSGQISTGYYPNNCSGSCNELGGYPFANQIDTLTFWYKYTPSGNDSANVNLGFKKNGLMIGWQGANLHAAATYQYKEIPFILGQVPDSVMVGVQSSNWNDTLISFVGSNLKIDEMHFKSQPLTTGIFNFNNENTLRVFPNPFSGNVHIQAKGLTMESIEVYNILGEKVFIASNIKPQQSIEIDLSKFQKGIYFLKIYDGEKMRTEKIIKQ